MVRLDRGKEVVEDVDALIDITVRATTMRRMMLSGPTESVSHYTGVEQALAGKRETPSRVGKRVFAREVCAAAQAHLSTIEPTLKRLQETEAEALLKLEEAHKALQAYLPKLDQQIGTAASVESIATREQIPAPVHRAPAMSPRTRQALAAHIASGLSIGG